MNVIFLPMFAQGMAGMLRRMADGGANYSLAKVPDAIGGLSQTIMGLNTYILWAAVGLALAQIPFIINFFWSIKHGESWPTPTIRGRRPRSSGRRPRRRRTATSPTPPEVHRGPYEYSVPGDAKDFTPQNEPKRRKPSPAHRTELPDMEIPYTVQPRPDTGLYNAKIGHLAVPGLRSDAVRRACSPPTSCCASGAPAGLWPHGWLNVPIGTVNTLVLITSSITTVMAWAALQDEPVRPVQVLPRLHACCWR